MKGFVADAGLVACCGLYCGACGSYRKGRCPGCAGNAKATWCRTRTCVTEHGWKTCADCRAVADPKQCRKFHNAFSRVIGFVLRSNRPACVARIREKGLEAYAAEMAAARRQSLGR